MELHEIDNMINVISTYYCEVKIVGLLQVPCVEAMKECLFDEGIEQINWCIKNILYFYEGI